MPPPYRGGGIIKLSVCYPKIRFPYCLTPHVIYLLHTLLFVTVIDDNYTNVDFAITFVILTTLTIYD